jgi:hypothetical protein
MTLLTLKDKSTEGIKKANHIAQLAGSSVYFTEGKYTTTSEHLVSFVSQHNFEHLFDQERVVDKLKVGTWYKFIGDPKAIVNYRGNGRGTGLNLSGGWTTGFGMETPTEFTLATRDEVAEALTKEAKKRGLHIGTRFNCVNGNQTDATIKEFNAFWHGSSDMYGLHSENTWIMKDGKWAKPLEDALPKIGGYKGEITFDGMLKYGCQELSIEWVLRIPKSVMSIHIAGVEVNRGKIELIQKYLKKDRINK